MGTRIAWPVHATVHGMDLEGRQMIPLCLQGQQIGIIMKEGAVGLETRVESRPGQDAATEQTDLAV